MVYLKTIESHGFKSFADKVTIQFDRGVTGVVGPNGSGKSNITDAIRWVLGEQSAKTIRGTTMQDVIFSGTDTRKPLNSAYVKLILSNESRDLKVDKDEVHILRKLYRSGESEYYLNNEKCRLKEITELFMDSGLGKNAYNIISQGEVDQVLKAKPEDRRHLIEEAAGVMKYKSRKKESEKKLDDTIENLSRVNDIIKELSSRVEQLSHESAVAKEYKALYDEMKESDIAVTVFDIESINQKVKDVQAEIESSESEVSRTQDKILQHNTEMQRLEENEMRLSEDRRDAQQALLQATRQSEQLSGNIRLYKERKENQSKAASELHDDKEKLINNISKSKETIASLEDEIKGLKQSIQVDRKEKKNLGNTLESYLEDDASETESLRDEFFELSVKKTTAENKEKSRIEALERRDSFMSAQREKLNHEERELESIIDNIQSLEEVLEKESSTIEALSNQLIQSEKEQEEKNLAMTEAKDKVEAAVNYMAKQRDRLEMLENIADSYQGFYPGVRAVLSKKDQLNGVTGAVSELFSVAKQYVTALDTALGASAQNIVMDSEEDAKQAIQYLRNARQGFATFLPLNTIKPRFLSQDIERALGNAPVQFHRLIDIVTFNDKNRAVAEHLLANTLVTETIEDATKLARALKYRVKIVTTNGDTLMPGGAMSGGSKAKGTSVLETKNEIETIQNNLKRYEAETEAFKADYQKKEEDYATTTEKNNELESKLSEARVNHDENRQSLMAKTMRRDTLQDSIESLKSTVQPIEEDNEASEDIDEIERQLEAIRSRLSMLNASDEEKRQTIDKMNEQIRTLERNIDSTTIHLNHKEEDLSEAQELLEEHQVRLERIDIQIEALSQDLSSIDIDALKAEQQSKDKAIETLELELSDIDVALSDIKRQLKSYEQSKEEASQTIDVLNQKLRSNTGQFEKLNTQLETKLAYLESEYKTTYEKEKETYKVPTDIEEKRKRIRLHKQAIEELGPVNLNAIEEFETVNTRYEFLREQESDLLEAHSTLTAIIKDMDEEVSRRFKEVYDEVNMHFKEVFTEMFGGGRAELRLTEPENYLESGIEILAEPPGKRLSSLSLLSGGERALTTISLLFSILKVRVSPFIILDEVEAALDEANVIRYARYLKELSKDSQFIVITHRKGTMEYSDRLFGLTMAERGVTTTISVDLNNYEEVIGE